MSYPEYPQRLAALTNSEGYKRWTKGAMWEYTYWAFIQNTRELLELLKQFEDPNRAMTVLLAKPKDGHEPFRRETIRHLQNFLAGACSLVDHTRNFMQEVYGGDPFKKEYEARKNRELGSSDLIPFVHNLRNYALHKGIPIVTQTYRFAAGEHPQFIVAVDLAKMRGWDGWRGGAKKFIASQPEELRIAEFVRPYFEKVTTFYQWQLQRRREIDAPHLAEMARLAQRVDDPDLA